MLLTASEKLTTGPAPMDRDRSSRFRPEIEGLRAVAVLLVVADHLIGFPPGGFIGVDVFFVISGFLISGLLAGEYAKTGRISITRFYQRRVRRILPAAILVLLSTWLVAQLLFPPSRAHDTAVDLGWAAVFLANIHFASVGTDYFQADRPPSPVQHFWSLSVEEQFYLVWPLLLFGLLFLTARLPVARMRIALAGVMTVIVGVLLLYSIDQTVADRSMAYFVTTARAWELGVGALLALVLCKVSVPLWLCRIAMPIGLGAIALSAVLVHAGPGFPAPLGLGPVLGAALVIVAGSGPHLPGGSVILTNPLSRYIGRISYSLYLWHWPVIIFVQSALVSSGPYFVAVSLLAMAATTVTCYEFIETPMRTFGLAELTSRMRSYRQRTRPLKLSPGTRAIRRRVGLAVLTLAVAGFVCAQAIPYQPLQTFAPTAGAARRVATPYGEVNPPPHMESEIEAALGAMDFPQLKPSLSDIPNAKVPEWGPCGNVGAEQLADCTFQSGTGDPSKTVVVIGDSIAITWLPAIRALQPLGYTIYALTHGQCPAADVSVIPGVGGDATFTAQCNAHRTWAIGEVSRLKPDVVVLASSFELASQLASGATGDLAVKEWGQGTTKMISKVKKAGAKRVVMISSPPGGPSLPSCASSASARPADCVGRVPKEWHAIADIERSASQEASTTYLDVRLLFCASNDYCPAFVGVTPVLVDGHHLTNAFSTKMGPILAPLIADHGS